MVGVLPSPCPLNDLISWRKNAQREFEPRPRAWWTNTLTTPRGWAMKARPTHAVRGTRAASGKLLSLQNWNRESRGGAEDNWQKQAGEGREWKDQSEEVGVKINESMKRSTHPKTGFPVGFQRIVSRVQSSRKRPRSQGRVTWRQHSVLSPRQPF